MLSYPLGAAAWKNKPFGSGRYITITYHPIQWPHLGYYNCYSLASEKKKGEDSFYSYWMRSSTVWEAIIKGSSLELIPHWKIQRFKIVDGRRSTEGASMPGPVYGPPVGEE